MTRAEMKAIYGEKAANIAFGLPMELSGEERADIADEVCAALLAAYASGLKAAAHEAAKDCFVMPHESGYKLGYACGRTDAAAAIRALAKEE